MKCPICNQEMRKVRWELTNNTHTGEDYKEYGKTTYNCAKDDVWINIEVPVTQEKEVKQT